MLSPPQSPCAQAVVVSFLADHGMSLEDAFHQPRIDASGGETVSVDPRLPQAIRSALAEQFPLYPQLSGATEIAAFENDMIGAAQ